MKRSAHYGVLIALVILVAAIPASAQRGFSGRRGPSGNGGVGRGFAASGHMNFGYSRGPRSFSRFRRSGWGYGYGLGWSDLFYPDYYARPDEPESAPPPGEQAVIEPQLPPKIVRPILIEHHGSEWVQISGYKDASNSTDSPKPPAATHVRPGAPQSNFPEATIRPLPPAILVYRDGHQEQVKGYTIIGNILYAKTDYWATGMWTKRIAFASLDIPATLKLNEEHGCQFKLPSGPREIVIRP